MEKKCKGLFLIILLIVPLLSSCWSSRQLNELAIATAIGIDKLGDQYLVSVQLIVPSAISNVKGSATGTAVTTIRSTGDTIFEAIRRMTKDTPRRVYMSHLRIIIFSEELAREDGLLDTLDFFSRDHEYRTDFFLGIAKDINAYKLLDITTPIERIPANRIFAMMENAQDAFGASRAINIDTFLGKGIEHGTSGILPGMVLQGEHSEGLKKQNIDRVKLKNRVTMEGMAVFNKDRLVGWLDEQESIGLNFIQSEIKNTIVSFPFKGEKISIELMRVKGKVKPSHHDENPKFTIEITGEGNIADAPLRQDINNVNTISQIEGALNKDIKTSVEKTVRKLQKDIKSDAVGFGDALRKNDPKLWNQLKGNWNEIFNEVPFEVNVKVNIRRIGTISNSSKKE